MRVVVIGAGIAGASAAWHLADHASVVMVEREAHPGAHATGRSAALHTETSGAPVVSALAAASRPFLADPPEGFADHALLSGRGLLWIARAAERDRLEGKAAAAEAHGVEVHRLDSSQCCRLVGVLRPDAADAGVYEPHAMNIDVDGLLQGFLRGARRRGAELHVDAGIGAVTARADGWRVQAGDQHWDCDVVVNAAGAWCDAVAGLAGVAPLGLRPLRRSVFVFPPPEGVSTAGWPMVWDIGNRFYFEPEGPLLLVSPVDETPSEPCDARPETEDIALGVEELEAATTLRVRGVRRTWAGLRTFAPDRVPVAGFDPDHPGFFWLAGQGGYGIKTSPALGSLAAALITDGCEPPPLSPGSVDALSPARFRG
ncbi:MAG: FAD-binding oxidoreductase [Acidimicrobiaceae bacterium]|nr:FAD-binding oxidoreductase [Acidimicrobiaceae bacterium]MYE08600.1 FAD-binding oxidoreductase [Acidimicrobiaceae bacterium]MYH92399.1 FAD-binding oxidoreductase [Acidimicrobiaceae bacterium]